MSIHTKIEQPISIRKDLLESAIDGVEILKTIENVKRIHHEKVIVQKKLKTVMDKIKVLDTRLFKCLPKVKRERKPKVTIEEAPVRKVRKAAKRTKKVAAPKRVVPRESKISKELDALRSKIEGL